MQLSKTILNSIKTVPPRAVVIIRTGSFCNVYGQDAYIISYLFGYKLRRIQNNLLSTGFPKEVINKVITTPNSSGDEFYAVASKKLWLHLLR